MNISIDREKALTQNWEGIQKMSRPGNSEKYPFGENLNRIMKTLQMSQVDLAQKSGLTQAAISQIISGDREPSLGTIVKILKVIPVKFEVLVARNNDPSRSEQEPLK